MFLRDARRIGTGIGIAAVITGGMAIVAVLLMAHGSSTISDSIHTMIGICMVIATAIRITDMRMILTHMATALRSTKAIPITTLRALTIRPIDPSTRPLPWSNSN